MKGRVLRSTSRKFLTSSIGKGARHRHEKRQTFFENQHYCRARADCSGVLLLQQLQLQRGAGVSYFPHCVRKLRPVGRSEAGRRARRRWDDGGGQSDHDVH